MVYFDNNAITPVHREVVEGMLPYFQEHWGNASSPHGPGDPAAVLAALDSGTILVSIMHANNEIPREGEEIRQLQNRLLNLQAF